MDRQMYETVALLQDDGLLHDVRDMLRGPTGDLWILTGSEPFVYHYIGAAPAMRLAASFGVRGEGPSDLSNPWALLATKRAAIEVWDAGSRRLVPIAGDGRLGSPSSFTVTGVGATRRDIRSISYGNPFKIFHVPGGFVLAVYEAGILHTADYREGKIVRLDSTGKFLTTLYDFREMRVPEERGPVQELVDIPLWHRCGDRIAVFDPFLPAIRWLDLGGREVSVTRIRAERKDLTQDDIRRYLRNVARLELGTVAYDSAALERQIAAIANDERASFPATAPYAVRMLCDGIGRVWLQEFDTERDPRGYGAQWLVVDQATPGQYVRFPNAFEPYFLVPGGAWGVSTDPIGVERIAYAEPAT